MRALRDGVDPDGAPLQPPMARYRLDARAIAALSAYLRQLSSETVPGIAGETLHLGTVITPDVPPPQREALLEVLRAYTATRNSPGMRWQLHVWQLNGAPQEWEAQLEEFYRQTTCVCAAIGCRHGRMATGPSLLRAPRRGLRAALRGDGAG